MGAKVSVPATPVKRPSIANGPSPPSRPANTPATMWARTRFDGPARNCRKPSDSDTVATTIRPARVTSVHVDTRSRPTTCIAAQAAAAKASVAHAGPTPGRTTRSTRDDAARTTATNSHGTDTSQLVNCVIAAGVSVGRPPGDAATTASVVATVADSATPRP